MGKYNVYKRSQTLSNLKWKTHGTSLFLEIWIKAVDLFRRNKVWGKLKQLLQLLANHIRLGTEKKIEFNKEVNS